MKAQGENWKRAYSMATAWRNEQLKELVGLGHCVLLFSGARIA